ncbi:hypothetical protein EVAR_89388_1 [Eumeta japonica]|uniref:Uncharacterized protein n=1 Tax=Eumeta variegata TaxID=151549 RepID=A0A4C1XUS9_EUMVA|nr:hypothetical protein EVAR_89388_1 [Eumeta japonica]
MKLGATSPRSLRKAGLCAYFGLERMPESRNERADEARQARRPLKKTAADYDRFPLSYAKGRAARSRGMSMFLRERVALETEIGVIVGRGVSTIVETTTKGKIF